MTVSPAPPKRRRRVRPLPTSRPDHSLTWLYLRWLLLLVTATFLAPLIGSPLARLLGW
jgi:hypothetical protein